jgi:two-component system, OmpR family, sensor histidine kinase KdpD
MTPSRPNPEDPLRRVSEEEKSSAQPGQRASDYLVSAAVAVLAFLVAATAFGRSNLADIVMIYLLGIVLTALRFGFGPSLLTTILSVLSFNFYFVPPYLTLAVHDIRHVVTFAVMLLVAVVISGLARRVRAQAEASRARERRTAALYAMSRELSRAADKQASVKAATRHIAGVFQARIALYAQDAAGEIAEIDRSDGLPDLSEEERDAVRWVFSHRREAGLGAGALPGAQVLYVPLLGSRGIVGVLGVLPTDPGRLNDPEERRFFDAFATMTATAVERAKLAEETEAARLAARAEELRSALLSSVSHDLRTPLAVITGAASALLDKDTPLDPATRHDLLQSIDEEAHRLNRIIGDLLDMTRLESGTLKVKKEWQPIEEVIGSALTRMDERLRGRDVVTDIPPGLPLAHIDGTLIEQVLINLLENATKYADEKSPIEVGAAAGEGGIVLSVSDRGPGVPAGEEEKIFDKFYRIRAPIAASASPPGFGLGLAICRGMIAAHGGRIWVEDRPGGGASFRVALPADEAPPTLDPPEDA